MGSMPTRLHLGCGLTTPEGWLNVDGSMNARIARFPWLRRMLGRAGIISKEAAAAHWSTNVRHHDVRKRLPWTDDSFEAVYASHLLEHLFLSEGRALLKESYRVLKPGGVLRVVVPDLRAVIDDYGTRRHHPYTPIPTDMAVTPADEFNLRVIYHDVRPVSGGFLMKTWRLHNNFHHHKWMYDEESLVVRLKDAGFADVRRMQCFESRIATIREIEAESRVHDGGLVVEGVKSAK